MAFGRRVVERVSLGLAHVHSARRALARGLVLPVRARRRRGPPVAPALPLRGLPPVRDDARLLRALGGALPPKPELEPRRARTLRSLLALDCTRARVPLQDRAPKKIKLTTETRRHSPMYLTVSPCLCVSVVNLFRFQVSRA